MVNTESSLGCMLFEYHYEDLQGEQAGVSD